MINRVSVQSFFLIHAVSNEKIYCCKVAGTAGTMQVFEATKG
jgi:hypothetical protein